MVRTVGRGQPAGWQCVSEFVAAATEPGEGDRPSREAPVWLALGRHCDRLARPTRHACAVEAARDGAERESWAGLAVNAAGIMPRQPGHLQALDCAPGLRATGNADLARDDLRRASRRWPPPAC
jgi:hypothetical protein